MLRLAFGLDFAALYTRDGALALDARFVEALRAKGPVAFRTIGRRAPADGWWQLVRSRNACGVGTYGPGRESLDAASPCP